MSADTEIDTIPARGALDRSLVLDIATNTSMAVGTVALVALDALLLRLTGQQTMSAFAASVLPFVTALAISGAWRTRRAYKALSLFCLLTVAVGYLIVERSRVWGGSPVSEVWIGELFAIAQLPVAALVWSALRAPHIKGQPELPIVATGVVATGNMATLACLTIVSAVDPGFALIPLTICAAYPVALPPPFIVNGGRRSASGA